MNEQQIDTRFRKRIACELNVDGKSHPGIVLNLSKGGLFVQTSLGVRPGTAVGIDLKAPAFQDPIALQAEVIWKRVVPRTQGLHGGVGLLIRGAEMTYEGLLHDLASSSSDGQVPPLGASSAAEPSTSTTAADTGSTSAKTKISEPVSQPEPATTSYRVRLCLEGSVRSKTVSIEAQSEQEAARAATDACEGEWSVIDVSTHA